MTHLIISARYTLKNKPKDQLGYRGSTVKYGIADPSPFASMMLALFRDVLDHYTGFDNAETLNAELDKVREYLAQVTIIAPDESEDVDEPESD